VLDLKDDQGIWTKYPLKTVIDFRVMDCTADCTVGIAGLGKLEPITYTFFKIDYIQQHKDD
jgi:hypothetical protein